MPDPYYWDVQPPRIRISSGHTVKVPISILGDPKGTPLIETLHPSIARIDSEDGCLTLGNTPGLTMALVYDSHAKSSVRYIEIEVVEIKDPNCQEP